MKFKKLLSAVFVSIFLCCSVAFAGGYKQAISERISVAEKKYEYGCKSGVTVEMLNAANVYYSVLDNELNTVYKKLMSVLPQKKKAVLKTDERNWIKLRDKKANAEAAKYNGGTFANVAYTDSLCEETKQRVLYLADYYDKVAGRQKK